MKKLIGLVLIILGAAVALDQTLGLLAGAHSVTTSPPATPIEALFAPLVMILIGIRWRHQ